MNTNQETIKIKIVNSGKMRILNYIGSKTKLFPKIYKICKDNIDDLENKTFGDLFAGTGVVGFNFEPYVKSVVSNDMEYYSYIINHSLLKCPYSEKIKKIINFCNSDELKLEEGLIYKNFSPNGECTRMFFTNENAIIGDTIQKYISKLFLENKINEIEYYFLLASVITSIDKVANVASVYGAYLKKYKKSALKKMKYEPVHTRTYIKNANNIVYNKSIENLLNTLEHIDIVYLDPPYNQRQYSGNYSQLNYIAKYDENIKIKGMTGLMVDTNKSSFCRKREVKTAMENIIEKLKCNHIILSYNNEGLLSLEELKEILLKKGDVILNKIQYNKFKAQQKVKIKYTYEFIWVIKVNNDLEKENTFEEIILQ